MGQKSALFASARVKARENKLIGSERFLRMLDAENAGDVLKVLYEITYADGMTLTGPEEYQKLLDAELKNLLYFFESVCPDENVLHCFFKKYDYHNAKALAKSKYLKLGDTLFLTYEKGLIEAEYLKECINTDSYTFLPKPMAEALNKIDSAYSSNGKNPRYTDIMLDKAMYEDICLEMEKIKDENIKNYFICEIDLINLKTAIKCRVLQMNAKEFEEQFIGGGSINIKTYISLIEGVLETASENFKYTKYINLVDNGLKSFAENGITDIELLSDNYLYTMFNDKRFDVSTIYPLLNYYLSKQSELKNVKLIFTGIIGGADKAEIKKRLRAV